MDIAFTWRLPWPGRRGETQILRFLSVLRAALADPEYREALRRAGIECAADIRAVRRIEDVLERLPPRKPAPHSAVTHARGRILCPLPCKVAKARAGRVPHSAEALAAPVEWLRGVALNGPPRLSTAVLPLLNWSAPELSAGDRELFWRAFQVPVFSQLVDDTGRVVAAECEAHDGLHVVGENAFLEASPAGLLMTSLAERRRPALRVMVGCDGVLERDGCPCGRPGPRLLGVRRLEPDSR